MFCLDITFSNPKFEHILLGFYILCHSFILHRTIIPSLTWKSVWKICTLKKFDRETDRQTVEIHFEDDKFVAYGYACFGVSVSVRVNINLLFWTGKKCLIWTKSPRFLQWFTDGFCFCEVFLCRFLNLRWKLNPDT